MKEKAFRNIAQKGLRTENVLVRKNIWNRIKDVKTKRETEIGSDQYLLIIKERKQE